MAETDLAWRKSSYCADGACVEVARTGKYIAVRDAKNPDQPPLTFTQGEWQDFLDRVLTGDWGLRKDV